MLSRFWLLRRWGGLSKSNKKGIFFQVMLNEFLKMISADVKDR